MDNEKMNNKEDKNTFIKWYKYTFALPLKESCILCYLIDADSFIIHRLPTNRNYFECCSTFMHNAITGISVNEIRSTINKLVANGYICKKIVNNNLQYIKINYSKIKDLEDKYIPIENKLNIYDIEDIGCDDGSTKDDNTSPENTAPANTAPANTAPVNTAPVNTAPANTAPVNMPPVNMPPVNMPPVNTTLVNTNANRNSDDNWGVSYKASRWY